MIDKRYYQAYLVRFQRGKEQAEWRATLQDTHSTKILRFATERELICYLLKALREAADRDESVRR